MKTISFERRLKWFDRGALALSSICPTLHTELLPADMPPVYLCPLCITRTGFQVFTREAIAARILTVDHVPAKKLGGKALLLTCVKCNNNAGSYLDAHAHKAETFANREPKDFPVRLAVGEFKVNMLMSVEGKNILLNGVPKHNSSAAQQALTDHFEELTKPSGSKCSLNFTIPIRHDPERARVAWLRAAYLVAFAKFGYGFALGKAMHAVRDKIRNPERDEIRTFAVVSSEQASHVRRLLVVNAPQELRGTLAVQMGRHTILLPKPDDVDFYTRLQEDCAKSGQKTLAFRGDWLPWPIGPEHVWDLSISRN